MQEIRLNEYRAQIKGLQLTLGTWDSYGIEKLKIIPGTGWEGLTITATFVTPEGSTRVLVPQDGLLPVPQEATAHPLPSGSQGQIVFTGVAEGIQRISTNVLYIVSDHAPIDGTDPEPTPDQWAQLVARYQAMLDTAVPPDGPPGYVLGATAAGNSWIPQTGGGGGGSSGSIITDDDTGTVYHVALHIQNGYPVLIFSEQSDTTSGSGTIITDDDTGTVYEAELHIQNGYPVLILKERSMA